MNKEENYKLFEYHSTKSNRELRKIFDNSNWNYNIQLFRSCEEIINDLQQENKQLKKQIKEALIDLDFFIEKYGLWQHKELIEIEETLRGNKNDKKKKNKTN